MIEINLLPEEFRKKETNFKRIDLSALDLQSLPIKNIAIYSVIALLSLHIVLFSVGSYCKAMVNSLTAAKSALLPKKKEADILKSKADSTTKKLAAIDELMVKRFMWAKKLNALSDSITPGVWLSGIDYDEKSGETKGEIVKYMTISGFASSMGEQGAAIVGKFIKSLKDNPDFYSDFSNIELGSIKSDKVENQEVMNFKITCVLKKG